MSAPQDSEPGANVGTTVSLKQRLADLPPEKLTLLQKRLQGQQRLADGPTRMLGDDTIHPLSFHQQRLWFIEQFQPGTPRYNITRAIRMVGPLNRRALRSALQALVDRHEALRTTFEIMDDEPVQRINPPPELRLPIVELQPPGGDPQGIDSLLDERLTAEGRRPFNLSADPMLRAVLYRSDDNHHVLQLTIHHLACDGWSLGLLFQDLAVLYRNACLDEVAALPRAAIRYVDFARWQREPRQKELFAERIGWWRHQLAGAPQVLELPTDRPRPPIESGEGDARLLDIPGELLQQLEMLGREEGVTLYMTLLAGFFILLHRYTGLTDFVVGSAIAGRHRAETHELVGFFVDTVALRADLAGEPTPREVLRRVRRTVVEAMENSDVPFDRVVEAMDVPKDLSRHPLFQVLFNIPPQYTLEFHRLEVSPVHINMRASRFDLEVTYSDGVNQPSRITWNTDLFEASTIERMAGHLVTLLKGIIFDPDRPIGQLPLMTDAERQRLLVEWNATDAPYPSDKCVHELFEEQALRTPNAVAVVFREEQLSYRELNERANQLAHHLRALGVGPECLVGLCLERSLNLAVGILGILKAGGAYVPLDPEYPADRIAFMLEDSAAAALVTEKALMERFGAFEGSRVCLDEANVENRSEPGPQETPLHHGRAESKHAAYVIYTSGSTGRPKGVVIPHSSLINLLISMRQEPGLRESDVLLSVTTPSFDIFGVELFLPLLVGARVVICDRPAAMDPVQLQAELDRSGATVMQATPATWQMLVQAGWPGQPGLRMFTGGESLPSALADALLARGAELWNLYGPTETTIWSTMSAIRATSQPITIGRPLASTQVYVLDAHRQPLPIGVPGELYIGGAGLARGYLNRPELTAEKFVPHPFSENPQARLYRTGDLVRWRADGNLEFLGRIDQQVKLRGFRIELGEIEAALLEHPSVAQCVVQLREDRPDDKRLIAYCVRSGRADWDPSVLTRHLLRRLPDYMVPSTIVSLESLPRTPNGKIDRRALPAPDDSRPELESQYVAPRTPLEEQLAGIWCEVLALDRVGIHDDFFTLGGHSLLAARVNARIFSVFGANLPLRRLFECPTIAGLAHDIEAQHGGDGDRAGKATRRLSPLPREQSRPNRFPLSFAQQRLWFLEQMEGELTAYNIPLAWRLRGRLNIEALRRTLEQIVHRHESLRTTYQFGDGDPVQTVLPPQRFELPISDLAGRKPEEREIDLVQLGLDDAQRRFDLTADLMLRATLVRVGDDDHALLLTMHHIASDGWSLSILRREIRLLYEAYCRGTEPDLPELPVQYADYAVWQREELLGDRLERLVAYWREQLRNVTPLELPTDGPRPPMPTYRGARCDFELSAELLEGLGALGQREGATLQMTLLAAFQLLLARYSGQTDIVVGTPIAGRNDTQIENLIGFFVNTLALRTDLSGDPTFLELLCRVRQVSLGAYDHQDLPFEMLVEKLQPERDLSRTPLAQVLFQLLSFPEKELTLAGVEVSRLPSFSRRARFDLEMHLWEHPGSLRGAVVYSVDLFDASTIERFVEHFTTLLKEIVDDAERPISALPLMTDAERQRLLVEWNATDAPYPSDKCVHEMFEEQVQRTPDAVAVVFGGEQLSYRELNQRANQVAHHLRALGVGPECLVGLCLERSLDLVVGILGILKAGGAYVPLDADYPPQRLAFILQDAKVRFVVTEQTLLGRLPAPGGRSDEDVTFKTVSLDADGAQLARLPSSNPAARAIADNLVYVIYTSGSTGTPKGVAMPHRALVNLIQWHLSEPRLGRASRTLQFASCNFDVSFQEMFTTWCCGGTLVLISEETQRDPQLLWRTIAAERVERLFVPFVALQQLALVPPSVPVGLKDIVSAGEALRLTPEIRQLLDTLNGCRLHNHYGPTESHVVTAHLLGTRSANWPTEAPIGRPIANTQVYVLDAQRQPVPSRVSGELYLGGVCLARGYLHRPELTAERFVPHPFSEDPAARLYRTGDLVRWCADGNLEFLGRIDQQVKLRGFRIELGEIEAVFLEHPLVAQCVVQLREDRPGDRRLVAYCVPAEGDRWDASGLLCHLRSRLPEYMVPSVLVRLAALPLSPNGKIDRRALPKPDESRPQLETEFAAPDAPIEQQLARIWADLLGLDRVGIDDDFFALGGHSLLAVRLVARIEKAFGRRLPLAALFRHGTIRQLADLLAAPDPGGNAARVLPLQPDGEGRALFFMPSIGGELLFSRALIQELGTEFPVMGLQPPLAAENIEQFRDFRTTARILAGSLRSYQSQGPYALAGFSYGGLMAYEVACLLSEMGEKVDVLAVIDTGPGNRGEKPRWGDACRRMGRIAANLPAWVCDECRHFEPGRWAGGAGRKLRRVYRYLSSAGRAKLELDDLFDVRRIPSQNRELMTAVFAALRDYQPRPYRGKLVLLRAETRSLLGGSAPDLGWRRWVADLEIRPIRGNHESILHPPHVGELARQLRELLE